MSEYLKISTGVGTLKTYTDASSLLEDALAHITMHPEQHQQDVWMSKTACGTVGCLAGWMASLDGQELTTMYGDEYRSVGGRYAYVFVEHEVMPIAKWAKDVLGLDDIAAASLFSGRNRLEDLEAGVKAYANGESVKRAVDSSYYDSSFYALVDEEGQT